jgi:short-subunit dehydrogenase
VTWVVVGASAGLGRALAERLAKDRADLLLVASDARDLEPLRADLALRFGAAVRTIAHDAADAAGLADAIAGALPEGAAIEGLLFPVGLSADDDEGTAPPDRIQRIAAVNFLCVAAVCGRLLPRMLAQGAGAIAGFGSVAAARGRGRNVVYAASKRALESYFESLRHLGDARGLRVSFYVLGYMDTALAYGRKLPFPVADPAAVAERVIADLRGGGGGSRHLPWWWAPIGLVVRALPWAVFRRMRF